MAPPHQQALSRISIFPSGIPQILRAHVLGLTLVASLLFLENIPCATGNTDLKLYQEILSTLSRRGEWPSARFAMAEIYYEAKQWDQAVAQWERLATEHRNDSLAPHALWRIIAVQSGPQNDKRNAIKTAQRLQTDYPDSFDCYLQVKFTSQEEWKSIGKLTWPFVGSATRSGTSWSGTASTPAISNGAASSETPVFFPNINTDYAFEDQ